MTKSFDDAVTHHKNNLIENLSQFHEGYRVRGLLMDIESNKSDYEYYFNTGKQSRQVEIELLEKEIIETQEFLNNQNCIKQAEVNDLKKRIEDIITSIDWHIEDCELWLSMNKNDSWKGGQLEILKAIKKRFSK